jgi:hypothetical protein
MMKNSKNYYQGEDEPFYKKAKIVLYSPKGEYFYLNKLTADPLTAFIQERDGSILYTVARALLSQTCHFVPSSLNLAYLSPFNGYPLFANPAINLIIRTLYEDDRVVIDIQGDTWTVFYPLDQRITNLEALN